LRVRLPGVPQASIEFEVADAEVVAAAGGGLNALDSPKVRI
jgi:hypothetical protein